MAGGSSFATTRLDALIRNSLATFHHLAEPGGTGEGLVGLAAVHALQGKATRAANCHSMSGSPADTLPSQRPFWVPRSGPVPGQRDGNYDLTRPSISRWAVTPETNAVLSPK